MKLDKNRFGEYPDPMFVIDIRTLAIIAANQAAILRYGFSKAEFRSKTLYDITAAKDIPRLVGAFQYTQPATLMHGNWLHQLSDRKTARMTLLAFPVHFGKQPAVLILARATQPRMSEQTDAWISTLHQRMEMYESRIEQMTTTLESAGAAITSGLRQKIQALASVKAKLDRLSGPLTRFLDPHLKDLNACLQDMDAYVGNLVEMINTDRKRLVRRAINLTKLAHNAAQELLERDTGHSPSITFETGLTAFADANMMQLALRMLIMNARQFVQNIPDPGIAIGGSSIGQEAVYYVRDNGAGHEAASLQFSRTLDSPTEEHSGLDEARMRLEIARRIIERHGGRLWADGARGAGTTVYFTLPRTLQPVPVLSPLLDAPANRQPLSWPGAS